MKIFSYDLISSTMMKAKELIDNKSVSSDFIVIAKSQSQGIGTNGRIWESKEGNLYTSIVIKSLPDDLNFPVSLIVVTVVSEFLENEFHICTHLKWPNDILLKSQKLCGILCEKYHEFMIIGIGINIKNDPDIKGLFPSTSLSQHIQLNKIKPLEQIVETIADNLLSQFRLTNNNLIIDLQAYYKKNSFFYNGEITLELPNGSFLSGIEKGIDNNGFLLIQTQKGIEKFHSARIINYENRD